MGELALAAHSDKPVLNPVLREFWVTPARIRVLHGGRSSSKSWDAAGMAIYLASNYKAKFLCTRQYQNRIEESVYSLLKVQIERFGLRNEFRILNNKIIHLGTGSEFLFYGLWRNIDEIKSLEGVDICWIEEAHNLLEHQWRVLRDTIRKEGSQFWIIFNPQLVTDFVYQRFVLNPPPRTVVRQINYDENPFLPETIRKTIEEVKAEDEDEFRHVYLGEPMTDDEQVIIKRRWINAAIDAHKKLGIKPSGARRIGFDVADDGVDRNATVQAYGFHTEAVDEWKGGEDELMKSCSRAYTQAVEAGASITYDAIGVGAHCGSKFKELNQEKRPRRQVPYFKFNAGGAALNPDDEYKPKVINRDFFLNLKAQAWWHVADRFRNTYQAVHEGKEFAEDEIISISSDCDHLERLVTELSTPRKDYNANGKVMVESKKDLEKRGIKSPNLADAYIMAYAPRERSANYAALTEM